MQLTADEVDRFWSHVVKGPCEADCWIWTGAIGDDGYGRFWVQSRLHQMQPRVLRPHRVAWALAEGESIDVPVRRRFERVEPEHGVRPGANGEGGLAAEGVRMGHDLITQMRAPLAAAQ